MQIANANIRIMPGTVTTKSALDLMAGNVTFININGQAQPVLEVQKKFKWSGGKIAGAGDVIIGNGAEVRILRDNLSPFKNPDPTKPAYKKDEFTPTLMANLKNSGNIYIGAKADDPASYITVDFAMASAILSNEATGVITILDSSNIYGSTGGIKNPQNNRAFITVGKGQFVKAEDSGNSELQVNVVGTLELKKGSSEQGVNTSGFRGAIRSANEMEEEENGQNGDDGDMLFTGPNDFDDPLGVYASDTMSGSGTLTGETFTDSGLVVPGGTGLVGHFTFNSAYTQTAGGSLAMELGGGNSGVAGTDYDSITVAGQVTLGGSLNLGFLSNYAASAGATFTLISNTSGYVVSGTFAGLTEGTPFAMNGGLFSLNYHGGSSGHDVVLTVVNPSATNIDAYVHAGHSVTLSAGMTNAANPSGYAPTLTLGTSAHGTVDFDDDGNIRFTPLSSEHFVGDTTFTYTLTDAAGGVAVGIVTVHLLNQAPTAGDRTFLGHAGNALVIAADVFSDPDGDAVAVVAVGSAANGTVSLSNGVITYMPNGGFTGSDTFTYQLEDEFGATADGSITVDVKPVPVTTDFGFEMDENGSYTGSVLSHDSSANTGVEIGSVSVATGPAYGSLTLNSDGSFTYVPDAYFSGTVTFTYTVTDIYGFSSTATCTITVNAVAS